MSAVIWFWGFFFRFFFPNKTYWIAGPAWGCVSCYCVHISVSTCVYNCIIYTPYICVWFISHCSLYSAVRIPLMINRATTKINKRFGDFAVVVDDVVVVVVAVKVVVLVVEVVAKGEETVFAFHFQTCQPQPLSLLHQGQ